MVPTFDRLRNDIEKHFNNVEQVVF